MAWGLDPSVGPEIRKKWKIIEKSKISIFLKIVPPLIPDIPRRPVGPQTLPRAPRRRRSAPQGFQMDRGVDGPWSTWTEMDLTPAPRPRVDRNPKKSKFIEN